ncbi:MAG: hypothetical protein JW874_04660 [Spirochaetales bacterium]|nr:hypothetical protein [Spirochaetales bacterium]
MRNTFYGVLLFPLVMIIAACAIPEETLPLEYGNSPGYLTHFLSAPDIMSNQVSINDLTINILSVESISESVDAIVASECIYRIVEEVDSAETDLTIDFTADTVPVPDIYYGMNVQWWSKYFLMIPEYRELARHVKFDIARFPGGQERMRYERDAATTDHDELGTDQPYQFRLTGEDISNFIDFCIGLGIEAEPEFNLYCEDPAMWADMTDQIINELGYDLRYLSAGNEPENDNHGSWNVMGVTNKTEALEKYIHNFLSTRQAIEAVKPDLTYALFETGQWNEPELLENLDTVLDNLGGTDPGALSVHFYPCGYWDGEPEYYPMYPSLEHMVIRNNENHEVNYLSTVLENATETLENHGLADTPVFIGEWSVSWSGDPASNALQESMAAPVYYAEILEYCKTAGYTSLQYFSFSDPEEWDTWRPALIGVSDNHSMHLRPVYYLYLMYEYFYGNQTVGLTGNRDDDWSIYASRSNTVNYIMLINRTESSRLKKTVSIHTDTGTRTLELTLHPHSVAVVEFE